MLARRAASGLKELRMETCEITAAFCSAVRAGGQPLRQLTSLQVALQAPSSSSLAPVSLRGMEQALAEVLAAGQLPMLRELHLSTSRVGSMLPVWRAVGEGACQRLQKINIDDCSPQQLAELAEAMRARPEDCEELTAVCLGLCFANFEAQATCEALQALLSRLSPRSLEELCLNYLPFECFEPAIVPALTSDRTALKTLKLSLRSLPSADGLLHALARGAMPSLTCLDVTGAACSDEAWRALGEAMGPEGTCLRRIKTLRLWGVIRGPRQLESLCRAMGTGHGCPELEVIKISTERGHGGEPWGAALAPAFRPPHGLPRLKELRLHYMDLSDLDQLVEALQHRPQTSQPMETLTLSRCELGSTGALGRAMAEGSSLSMVKQLSMSSPTGGGEEWPMQLAEALAGGAGQQLEEIEWKSEALSVDVVNRLLQGLAVRGTHPKLRRLMLGRLFSVQGGQLDACSLGTILAGRAACSVTLRELHLNEFSLSNEGVRRLAACLREPQAIQLECFELCAGEPDACGAVMELLSALGGRAGDRLQRLVMFLPGCEEGEAMPVVEHVVGLIRAGGLPAMRLGQVNIFIPDGEVTEIVGKKAVWQALKERVQAQWLASW